MKPTLSLSAAFSAPSAPERTPGMMAAALSAAAATVAAAAATDNRMFASNSIDGYRSFPAAPPARAQPESGLKHARHRLRRSPRAPRAKPPPRWHHAK